MVSGNLLIIFNLFILETLLSVDNAAVLSIMVKDLPVTDRSRALKFGMFGAFLFRGICLVCAAYLVKLIWIKIVGGAYLGYLVWTHFKPADELTQADASPGLVTYLKSFIVSKAGVFWSTVILVEVMDLAFSLDNVFAAVAMSNNIYLILSGVLIGIVAMRFVAQWFTRLMVQCPSLETSAFIVIGLLALKLILTGVAYYIPSLQKYVEAMNNYSIDMCFSGVTVIVFITPLLYKSFFGKVNNKENIYSSI